ncbi:MAG TPA: hypothetical protein VJX67_20960 [Blastocatellia bacterium]|nr:hypothetical protein [Blastocatellia bacterium]
MSGARRLALMASAAAVMYPPGLMQLGREVENATRQPNPRKGNWVHSGLVFANGPVAAASSMPGSYLRLVFDVTISKTGSYRGVELWESAIGSRIVVKAEVTLPRSLRPLRACPSGLHRASVYRR